MTLIPSSVPVYLSFFGTDAPERFGIKYNLLPSIPDLRIPGRVPERLHAGVYCISATMLQSVYSRFPGHWTKVHEEIYQESVTTMRRLVATQEGTPEREKLIAEGGKDYWSGEFIKFESIRFARLTAYLRHRGPDDMINNSILIFRLSEQDLIQALQGPPPELDPVQDQ